MAVGTNFSLHLSTACFTFHNGNADTGFAATSTPIILLLHWSRLRHGLAVACSAASTKIVAADERGCEALLVLALASALEELRDVLLVHELVQRFFAPLNSLFGERVDPGTADLPQRLEHPARVGDHHHMQRLRVEKLINVDELLHRPVEFTAHVRQANAIQI